jgi:hypothetical protein
MTNDFPEMKQMKFILPLLFLFLGQYAQGGTTILDLESNLGGVNLRILSNVNTDSNNVWDHCIIQKNTIDTAFSNHWGIVTDSINPYPINDTSYFDLKYWVQDDLNTHSLSLFGRFWSDLDSNDYVSFQVSPNNGVNWYDLDVKLTGETGGWSGYFIDITPFNDSIRIRPGDSVIIRHIFMSDSIFDNRDGIAFDYFEMTSLYVGLDEVHEDPFNSLFSFFQSEETWNIVSKSTDQTRGAIYSIDGKKVHSFIIDPNSTFKLNLKEEWGLYSFCELSSSQNRFVEMLWKD